MHNARGHERSLPTGNELCMGALRHCSARAAHSRARLSRFCGDEKLPCNCGAASCRGFVNAAKSRTDGDAQLVLRSRLKLYKGQKLCWDGR